MLALAATSSTQAAFASSANKPVLARRSFNAVCLGLALITSAKPSLASQSFCPSNPSQSTAAQSSSPSHTCAASQPAAGMAATATTVAPLEVLVKAAVGQPDILGDCPFSQRVLITLEEKEVPYNYKLVDTANKPQWFLDANPEGKVPVIKQPDGSWLADSDVIVAELEEQFPAPAYVSLEPPEDKKSVGSSLFGAFVRFLKSKDASDGTEAALIAELTAFDDALKASGGPFVAGERFTAIDAAAAPRFYHLRIALNHFKQWSIPASLTHVQEYIKAVESRDSFKETEAGESVVISGWSRALGITA